MAIEAQWMQNGSYSGREDRQLLAAGWDEGVLTFTALRVTQHSPSADMSVDVAVGRAVVDGDDQPFQGAYLVTNTAVVNVPLNSAPGSNSRYDRIILKVRDPDAGGDSGDDAQITVVTGTPSASPSVPAVPASAISLAVIGPIGVGKLSILTADILDDRPIAGAKDSAGVLKPYTGPSNRIPTGWLLADGSEVSRALYADLAALYESMGWPFGNGNGSTTFDLPDLRDRQPAPIGTYHTDQGDTGGATNVQLTESELPAHSHLMPHTHTTPNHTHAIDHNHAAFNSGSAGSHFHETLTADSGQQPSYDQNYDRDVAYNDAGWNQTVPGGSATDRLITDTEPSHQHAVDVPAFTGSTPSGGGGTTGASSAASTAETGDSIEVAILDPYLVVTGYIVRT